MQVTTMRKVDAWAGVPVCWGLTFLRRAFELVTRQPPDERRSAGRVVFVKLAEQGATVLAYPAILRAVRRVGAERVFFVVFEENRFILDVLGLIPRQNVLAIPSGSLVSTVWGAIRVLVRLRRLRPDVAIDYEFFARSSAALAYLSGARLRVGLHPFDGHGPYRGDLMTHRIEYDPDLHTADLFCGMVEAMDKPPGRWTAHPQRPAELDPLPEFQPAADEVAEVDRLLRHEAGAQTYRPLVLLNANASDLLPLRRWPEGRYVELARRLLQWRPDLHVAFTGAPEESEVAERLVLQVGSGRCFSMAGKTSLRQLLVLYCLADVLVTNDSGPAHFATLTPIRVVTLFGPETPRRFGSRSQRTRILWANLDCSPCVDATNNRLSSCRNNRCMQQIAVQDVFQAVTEALKAKWAEAGSAAGTK